MIIKKTKNGFKFKGDCSADYKDLGRLLTEMSKLQPKKEKQINPQGEPITPLKGDGDENGNNK
jgi:hypothetical protein